ncbi:hypothetical protein Btru_061088 [Bulinus truncatus]|nr:hypothetical protein Btru_061088 [Bulinus truncatus]
MTVVSASFFNLRNQIPFKKMSLTTTSQEQTSVSEVTDSLEQDIKEGLLLKKEHRRRPLRRHSSEDEGLEIKFPDGSELDFDVVKTVSLSRRRRMRSSSEDIFDHVYDDSGFNSSDDDKDDVTDSCFDSLSLDSAVSSVNSIDSTDLAVHANIITDCVTICDKDKRTAFSVNTPAEIQTLQNITDISTDPDTMSSGQLVSSSSVNALGRCRHRRRHRIIDSNNNDTVITENRLHSYLKPPPFKLNECFQDKGLFCLLVCIVYTLLLFFILGCVGVFMDIIRSALTKDDLAEIGARFPHTHRHRRTNVTSG